MKSRTKSTYRWIKRIRTPPRRLNYRRSRFQSVTGDGVLSWFPIPHGIFCKSVFHGSQGEYLVFAIIEGKVIVSFELQEESRGWVSNHMDDLAFVALVSGRDEDCDVGWFSAVGIDGEIDSACHHKILIFRTAKSGVE